MTSRQYWKTRAILLEQLLHDRSEATAQRISRLYGLAQESIFQHIERVFASYVKGGALNDEKAVRLLSVRETEEAERELRALYETATGQVKRDIWARLSAPAYANRISRLQALRDRIYLQARMMGLEEVSYVRDRLSDTLEQSYYRTTFDIQHFTGEYYDFDRLTDRQIKAALATDWNGKNWSERIWDNNQMFADAVEDTVTVGIMTGQRYDEMRDNLLHVIGLDDTEGARYRSARLVQTECAYVANQGHLMGYQAAEIEKYIFLATLDLRTSKICRSLDGKRFLVSEAQPGTNYPPMHPWCRSTTMPDMTAEQLRKVPRAARDPKTGKSITVPGDMTYQQWYEKFVEGTKDSGRTKQRNKAMAEPLNQATIEGWNNAEAVKPEPEKNVENSVDSGIISLSGEKEGALVTGYSTLGNIDTSLLEGTFGPLPTDELIITNERLDHIQQRHPEDFELFLKYGSEAAQKPDSVIQDCSNIGTVFLIKKLPSTNLNVVVRLSLGDDEKHPKHSVMTFFRIRERNLRKLEKKNMVLYKRPESEYNIDT